MPGAFLKKFPRSCRRPLFHCRPFLVLSDKRDLALPYVSTFVNVDFCRHSRAVDLQKIIGNWPEKRCSHFLCVSCRFSFFLRGCVFMVSIID